MTSSAVSRLNSNEVQTDPIMVPFPLPPIGPIRPSKCEVMSVSIQTDYVWMLNEFPMRNSAASGCFREENTIYSVSPKTKSPRKKSSERKGATTEKPIDSATAPENASMIESAVEVPPQASSPLLAEAVVSEKEVVAVTPKKVPSKKSKLNKELEEQPATPATSAGSDTPVATVSSSKKKNMLNPVFSDSSDDDLPLLNSAAKVRNVSLLSVKPSISSSPVERPSKRATPEASSSESEAGPNSSSSESDADVPSVSLIASKKRKESSQRTKETSKPVPSPVNALETPTNSTRLGPLVQIDDVTESHLQILHNRINELLPEPLRSGAIKEAVFDEPNNRILFHLRMTPNIVNFLSANGGMVKIDNKNERKLTVLSDSLKKKAASLFKEETPLKKRREL